MAEQEPQSKVVPSVRGRPALSVMGQPSVSLSSPDTPTPILFRYNTAPLCHSSPFQQQWADAWQCFVVFSTLVFCCQGGKPPIVFTPMDFLPPDSHAGRRKRKYILAYTYAYGLKEGLKWPKQNFNFSGVVLLSGQDLVLIGCCSKLSVIYKKENFVKIKVQFSSGLTAHIEC